MTACVHKQYVIKMKMVGTGGLKTAKNETFIQ